MKSTKVHPFVFASLLFLVCLLTSCFKDDPVINDVSLVPNEPEVLIVQEETFNITSKRITGGRTFQTGYATTALKTIDPNTGKILAEKETGRHNVHYVGFLGGKTWFYSDDEDIGLHSRMLDDLDVDQTFRDIVAQSDTPIGTLSSVPGSIGLDTSGKRIFLTTADGYHYLFDPATNSFTKTTKEGADGGGAKLGLGELTLDNKLYVNFKGDTRKHLVVARKVHDQRAYDFYAQGGKPVSEMMYTRREDEKAYESISFIRPEFVGNPPIYDNRKQLFILSRTSVENDYNWLLTAVQVTEDDAQINWRYDIGKGMDTNGDVEFVAGFHAAAGLALAFENELLLLNTETGQPVWKQKVN